MNLQNHALATNDNLRLLASVSGIDWQEIIPQELKYHKSCYINITREKRQKPTCEDALTDDLVEYIYDK